MWSQAEMARLQQLGDILGMTQFDVAAVHQDLSEQAYKSQVGEGGDAAAPRYLGGGLGGLAKQA
jgi:hypothetical protein